MINEGANIWFAKSKSGQIVTIDKINDNNKHEGYMCPICNSQIIPKAIKEDAKMIRHFAHKDASKCDRETQIHFFVKNELLKQGDKFIVRLDSEIKQFVCKEILIEQEYKTEFGTYKPDITVITEDNKTIYFEVAYTNKKKIEDYLDIWIELNNIVVEVKTKEMIEGNILNEFNALFYEGKCFNIRKEDKEYYNLIGKIKLNKNKYPIEQVNRLNWLWKDINKYLLGEVDISDISDLIQAIEDKEFRKIVVFILKKNKCSGIMGDYIKYNIDNIKKEFKITENEVEIEQPRLIYDRIYGKYNIYGYNLDEYIDLSEKSYSINRVKNKILKKVFERKQELCIKNIEPKINEYLKNINKLYSIINTYSYDNKIKGTINYNYSNIFELEYEYYENCDEDIINYIKEMVEDYMSSLDIIKVEDIAMLSHLCENINNTLKLLNSIKYTYYTRLSSWHPRKHTDFHKYILTSKCISEDKYKITVDMLQENIVILITNKTICINSKEKVFNNNKDYNYIQKEIMNFISDKIRKERYKL